LHFHLREFVTSLFTTRRRGEVAMTIDETLSRTVLTVALALIARTTTAAQNTSAPDRTPMRPAAEPAGALPYDLAFDIREFLWSSTYSVSHDGRRVAYAVRQPPRDVNLSSRFMPNGTPSSVVGAKVYLSDTKGGQTTTICPGGSCWAPVISPDGATLVFYSDKDGPPQLWAFDIATARTRRVSPTRIKAKLWTGDEAQWSSDSRTVFVPTAPDNGPGAWLPAPDSAPRKATETGPTVSVLRAGSEQPKSTDSAGAATPRQEFYHRENNAAVSAIDVRSGTVRLVVAASAEPRPSVVRLSASGKWLSYLSVFKDHGITNQTSTIDLAIVPASGGTPRVVVADLPLLNDYHGRNYSWHPTDDQIVYMKDGKLWAVAISPDGSGTPRRLGESLGALAPTHHWFTRDGKAVVVGTDPLDEKGYGDVRPRGLAVIPLDGSAPARIAIDPRWSFEDLIKSGQRTVWQPDGASVTTILTEVETGERAAVRFSTRNGQAQVLWKGRARIANLTGGGDTTESTVYGLYQDVRTPPNVYRFPADFASKVRISHADDRLDNVAVGSAEVFETTIPGYNGALVKARTAVLLPPGAKRGDKLPALVLMYPGGDRARQSEIFGGGGDLTIPNLLLTSRGYAVVLASLPLGPNREAGNPLQEMIDELLPQVYRAAELGYVDVNRLAIAGQSFGGYGTGSIISGTNLFRAAVAVSGIYDLAGTYGYLDDNGGSFWIGWSEGGQARMGSHPWANVMRYLENSPYYRADKIRTPLLLIHGDKDEAYHDAQKLFSALRRLDRPVQLATYGGMGHVIYEWTRPNAVDAAQRIVDFIRTHLGPPKPATITPE
jgi:dipeptidyl aminopeptidase/acylaminoacyl peptidase